MKEVLVLVFNLSCSFALLAMDWSKVKPRYAFVTPKSNGTKPMPSITGGRESVRNSRPYQAAVIGDNEHFCGGSVISPNYILTAAHCLHRMSKVEVILGAHAIKENEPTQVKLESSTFTIHAKYNSSNLNYDIGLVKLPRSVEWNEFIQQIPLASSESSEGVQAVASGWGDLKDEQSGLTSKLHEVDLSIITNKDCAKHYREDVVKDFTLCTSGVAGVGTCYGDSGGPLVANKLLIGISSFTSVAGCQGGSPSGYVRVSELRSWIMKHSDAK